MSIKIKDVELKSNIILAPMAGFSDYAFRKMCSDYGAGLTVTEMVSSQALHYKNEKTEKLLISLDGESPKAVQIFGHDPEIMAEAVRNPLLQKFDIIDINMGCPAPKIVKNGDGSALLKNIDLARQIITACVNNTTKPVTVKFRIGYTQDEIVAVRFAKMCEEAGASAITVHGRTTSQGYSGTANYEEIRKVKEAVKIPVFANGDCKTADDLKKILEITKADGVMIGRAAIGHPEIFSEIQGIKTNVNKLAQIKFHYESLMLEYSELAVVKMMRTHLAGYLSGKYRNPKIMVELMKAEKYVQILEILEDLLK